MTRRSDMHMTERQWAERRRIHQTMLEAQYFAAELVAGLTEPSAPEGRRCDICDDVVVDGKCPTCEAVYVDGVRQPEYLPFADEREITS